MANKDDNKSDVLETENKKTKVKKPLWRRLLKWGIISGLIGTTSLVMVIIWAIITYGQDLPDYRQLQSYEPAVITRVHAGDGSLMQEFSRQPRLFIPIDAIPERMKQATLAAEDKNFYTHGGIDYWAFMKGMVGNIKRLVTGQRLVGASTITQQVTKNFLLSSDRQVERKIKEAILAVRMERVLTKDQILELYLNDNNMGNRSYGVAAAALNYFNKPLDELTLAQYAYLAAIPKGPHNYHPVRNKARAIGRRNWVLSRMHILGYITSEEYEKALQEDLVMVPRTGDARYRAEYFTETVRRELLSEYGEKALYTGGLSVRTTLEPRMQAIAEQALRRGLAEYDRRHGWRGPVGRLSIGDGWAEKLAENKTPLGVPTWQLGLVLDLLEEGAVIGLKDGGLGFISLSEMKWARAWRERERLGPTVKFVTDVLAIGDVIVTERLTVGEPHKPANYFDDDGNQVEELQLYKLWQIPAIEGALVALDPHTGRVLAMVGGFDFNKSQFNRATQAKRQPGSAFKPFVYAAAIEAGFTPSSLVLDAPFVMAQGDGQGKWKPQNSSNQFYGPSTLRLGIEKSRNLMTVRLAQSIGMQRVMTYAQRFGLNDNMQPTLAMSLGAGEVTPLQLTAAYGMLVNGGKEIKPTLIDRIQDRRGRTIFKHDKRRCLTCTSASFDENNPTFEEPELPDNRKDVLDPRTAYQLVSMMEGVVERGTGRKIRVLNRPLAGKTGTTNDGMDAWFVGFSPDLAVGVFTGFDIPRSLGQFEEGSSVAVPIFRDFMREALRGADRIPFRIPEGIRLVRVNAKTGLPAEIGDKDVILEAFIPGTTPKKGQATILDGSLPVGQKKGNVRRGSGGIY